MEEKVASAEGDSDLRKELLEIYTPLSVAKEEIWRRWNDKELRKKVENFLGGDVPEFLGDEPLAVLSRYIASPNIEMQYFVDYADLLGLNFALVEYSDDKLVAQNICKYHLCNIFLHKGRGKKLGDKIEHFNIVNFHEYEGKNIRNVKTIWNQDVIDFHHTLFSKCYPCTKEKIYDFSDWFNRKRIALKKDYYVNYLTLFVCYGVLFENFLLNNEEREFTLKKVLPSFKKVHQIFGVKPLVIPLQSFASEEDSYWCYYNGNADRFITEMVSKGLAK